MQATEQKSIAQSRGMSNPINLLVAFKENPKQESEGVLILMDEQREFQNDTEVRAAP